MTHEKYEAFLEAAIRKTKSGAIFWERVAFRQSHLSLSLENKVYFPH